MTTITASTPPAARLAVSPAVVYRRRRTVAAVLVATVLSAAWLLGAAAVGELAPRHAGAAPPGAAAAVHVVQPGETLWSIAATIDHDGDVRDTVDRLVELNGGAALDVGARVVLPDPGP